MQNEMREVWNLIREKVKQQVTGRTLYRALDALMPVTIEGDTVVLGLPHEEYQLAGHVNAPHVRRLIEQYLMEAYGFQPNLIIIEGTTLADWQLHLRKQEELRKLAEQTARKQTQITRAYTTWDSLYEQVGRKFAEVTGRSLALNRARYLQEVVQMVREALTRLPIETEQDERQLNRVIERIAANAEVPAAMVAWMILYETSSDQP